MSYLDSPAGTDPGRIVIVSASVGAGHDGAAAELARRLRDSGHIVERHDFLDLLPARIGKAVCAGYHRLLTLVPSGYQRIYASTERHGQVGPGVRAVLRTAERRTLRALPADTRAVVSTYFGASQVLGALRRSGRLNVPVFTYLTDFSVHPLWVAAGIDVHLAAHAVPAGQARALGAAGVLETGPVVNPRFTPATEHERRAARARFGLPERAPLALLVAGSWGVGPVEQAAFEIRDTGAAVPVVVCGRNTALAERLRASGIEHAFGWVDDMPGLMHASDVLVQNAGGLSSLEAFASGLPVASYGCIPGHGRTNAAALDEAGLAVWIRTPEQLKPILTELLDGPRGHAQREAALDLFTADPAAGPVAAVLRTVERRTVAAAEPAAGDVKRLIPGPRTAPDEAPSHAFAGAVAGAGAEAVRPLKVRRPSRFGAAVGIAATLFATWWFVPDAAEAAVAHSGYNLIHAALDR
ncbi:UDP-N-acetylglucosamine--N-acetylglucosamine transferase [Streptomyces sp. RB6PN25]|uniref:UDP-N-acetylglucosamine--N-acetylglucosamine transferase n=1 Tax=Streptomyces humicola TaxID=2953240 RepID=A0ABT1PXR9_9ACTN|nr:UDP-N-acetylglucosamine--N-acetylglucosamine transferase [Streptomyces humicola]MCQ4082434.1 UDP-N-acetylglucosamine--N-acetylglucosamine transferase [Streptomyces humicola]